MITKLKFKRLKFDSSTHSYFLGDKPLTPVSNEIKKFHKPFDARLISNRMAKNDPVEQKKILNAWAEKRVGSARFGTQTHNYGEAVLSKMLLPKNSQELGILEFWMKYTQGLTSKDYKVALIEVPLYTKKYNVAGTPDVVLYNKKENTYEIIDYKTNADLFKNYKGQRLLPPFDDMLDCPFSKYIIQLSLYQICLEDAGIKVSKRVLVWLTRTETSYHIEYELPDVTERLRKYYEDNK